MTTQDIHLDPHLPFLAQTLGGAARVGAAFVHVHAGITDRGIPRRLVKAMGVTGKPVPERLVPRWGAGEELLPGAVMTQKAPPLWPLLAAWSDREAYTRGEPVHLAILCPGCPLDEVEISVSLRAGGKKVIPVAMRCGAAHVELRGLPPGDWSVSARVPWPDLQDPRDVGVHFTILDNRTLPLAACWEERSISSRSAGVRACEFAVGLKALGAFVTGDVRVCLENLRLKEKTTLYDALRPDVFGVVRGSFTMSGAGPYVMVFETHYGGKKQARLGVPLRSRFPDMVSMGDVLGGGVMRRALPHEEGTSLGVCTFPENTDRAMVRAKKTKETLTLEFSGDASCASILVFEPLSGRFHRLNPGAVQKGHREKIEVQDPFGMVVAGLGSASGLREEWGAWASEPLRAGIHLSWAGGAEEDRFGEHADASLWIPEGERARILLKTEPDKAEPDKAEPVLFLVLHEQNMARGEVQPRNILASLGEQLLEELHRWQEAFDAHEEEDLFQAAGGEEALRVLFRQLLGEPRGIQGNVGERRRLESEVATLPISGGEWSTLQMSVLEVNGSAEIELPPAPKAGRLLVQALGLGGVHWTQRVLKARAGSPVEVEWDLPPFVDPGDRATGRISTRAWAGDLALWLWCDDHLVALEMVEATGEEEAEAWGCGARLPDEARFAFAAVPGRWTLMVVPCGEEVPLPSEGRNAVFCQRRVVSRAGAAVRALRRVRCLGEGDKFLPSQRERVEVIPSPAVFLKGYLDAIHELAWDTCDVLAARATVAVFRAMMGEHEAVDARQEVERVSELLRGLLVPGRGFAARTPGGQVIPAWSRRAVRHLLRLETLLRPLGESPRFDALRRWVKRAVELGERGALAMKMVLPIPAEDLRDVDDAELFWRMRPQRLEIAARVARASLKRRASYGGHGRRDEEKERADQAWAARILLETGDPMDRDIALRALARACCGSLRGALGSEAGWGVEDSMAVVWAIFGALGKDLRSRGVVELEGEVHDLHKIPEGRFSSVRVLEGLVWITWSPLEVDDLTCPSAPIPLTVHLRRKEGKPESYYALGSLLTLDIDLGSAEEGGGYVPGDFLELHLPEALALAQPESSGVMADLGGKRLIVDMGGQRRVSLLLRAVSCTCEVPSEPRAQHFALALRNARNASRGRAMVGLDLVVVRKDNLAERLRRGVKGLLR